MCKGGGVVAYEPWTSEQNETFEANHEAPPGQIWVCSACGKRVKNSVSGKGGSYGWDESCFLHAMLCYDEPGAGTAEKPWRAVE